MIEKGGDPMARKKPEGNMFRRNPDRTGRNDSDGQTFYGYDTDDGRTEWYTKDGYLDSVTVTPYDDDDDD